MRTLSQGFGIEKVITLDSKVTHVPPQKTQKQTPDINRIPLDELEYAYIRHPMVFTAINKMTQAIMAAGWELRAKDPKVLEFFNDFIENVGRVGEDVTFDEILESLFKYQMIYGNTYLETVPGEVSKDPNNIVDLVILDPKRIDYAKTQEGMIDLDKYGKPIGFIQSIPYEIDPTEMGDKIPENSNVVLDKNQIFLLPERISLFKLHTYGDRFYSQGLIDAGYKSIIYELSIKKAHANALEIKGSSPIIDYVGDTFHEPTPAQIDNALTNLKQMRSNQFLAFPYWHRVESVEMKETDMVNDTLKYLREDISSSLGIPLVFATGAGDVTNRSTLATQLKFLTFTLNDMVKKTTESIRKFIFKRICEFNNFDEVPRIVFGNIGVEEINDKFKRIVGYTKEGIIEPSVAREYAIESERLESIVDNPLDTDLPSPKEPQQSGGQR